MSLKPLRLLVVLLLSSFALWLIHPIILLSAQNAPQAVHYVSADANCGGEAPCYQTIQAAVDGAAPHDVIKVAAGSYVVFAPPPSAVVTIDKPLTLLGGYTAADWNNAQPETNLTVVDAQGVYRRRVMEINVNNTDKVLIQGFIIQGGNGDRDVQRDGGGLYILNGDVTITGNTIRNNEGDHGGGLYLVRGKLSLTDNIFRANSAYRGGGLWVNGQTAVEIRTNTFVSNTAYTGGAAVLTGLVTAIENQFIDNDASNSAVFIGQLDENALYPQVTLTDNYFNQNDGEFGGALNLYQGETEVNGNRFINNSTTQVGGAVYIYSRDQNTLIGNYFAQNTARIGDGSSGGGSAIFVYQGPVASTGNIFYQNDAETYGTTHAETFLNYLGDVTAVNDIFGYNTDSGQNTTTHSAVTNQKGSYVAQHITFVNNEQFAIQNEEGYVHVSHSIFSDHGASAFDGAIIISDNNLFYNNAGCTESATCISPLSGDPMFVDAAAGDFHIQATSSARDIAIGSMVTVDFEGDIRPSGLADVGADEFACGLPVQDLRGQNIVTSTTMLTMTLTWTPPVTSTSQELRWSDAPLDNLNWLGGVVITAGLPYTVTSYTATVPYTGDGTLFFAQRYGDNECAQSTVSNNFFWPSFDLFLPVVTR